MISPTDPALAPPNARAPSKVAGLQDPENWQKRAEEARELADATDDVTAKASLVDIAHNYQLMAERFAKGT